MIDALQTGMQLDKIYLDTKVIGDEILQIKKLAASNTVPVSYVPVAKLNGFNVTNHEGIIAQIAKVQYQNLQELFHLLQKMEKFLCF